MKRLIALAFAGALLAGCGSNAKRDLEGAPSVNPDKATVYNNVNGHPNLAVLCIDGAAWVTNTRAHDAALPDPRLDKTCPQG